MTAFIFFLYEYCTDAYRRDYRYSRFYLRVFLFWNWALWARANLGPVITHRFVPARSNYARRITNVTNGRVTYDVFTLFFRSLLVNDFCRQGFTLTFFFGMLSILFRNLTRDAPLNYYRLINFAMVPRYNVITVAIITASIG